MACNGGGTKVTDAAAVRELSEKDVMTVLDIVRKEFSADDRRIYLTGHSMGASGTLYLGAKHADIWAAIAADAPPGAPNAEGIAAAKMPTLINRGDADTAVPVAGTRRYVERLKETCTSGSRSTPRLHVEEDAPAFVPGRSARVTGTASRSRGGVQLRRSSRATRSSPW